MPPQGRESGRLPSAAGHVAKFRQLRQRLRQRPIRSRYCRVPDEQRGGGFCLLGQRAMPSEREQGADRPCAQR